jgi:hypothetical protein
VGPRVAAGEPDQRLRDGREQRFRDPARQRGAERVPITRHLLDRHEPALTRQIEPDGAPGGDELEDERRRVDAGHEPRVDLGGVEVAEGEAHVVEVVGVRDHGASVTGVRPGLSDDLVVEEVAQLDLAEELAKPLWVEAQRLRSALGERHVALVEEAAHVAEEQRARER